MPIVVAHDAAPGPSLQAQHATGRLRGQRRIGQRQFGNIMDYEEGQRRQEAIDQRQEVIDQRALEFGAGMEQRQAEFGEDIYQQDLEDLASKRKIWTRRQKDEIARITDALGQNQINVDLDEDGEIDTREQLEARLRKMRPIRNPNPEQPQTPIERIQAGTGWTEQGVPMVPDEGGGPPVVRQDYADALKAQQEMAKDMRKQIKETSTDAGGSTKEPAYTPEQIDAAVKKSHPLPTEFQPEAPPQQALPAPAPRLALPAPAEDTLYTHRGHPDVLYRYNAKTKDYERLIRKPDGSLQSYGKADIKDPSQLVPVKKKGKAKAGPQRDTTPEEYEQLPVGTTYWLNGTEFTKR